MQCIHTRLDFSALQNLTTSSFIENWQPCTFTKSQFKKSKTTQRIIVTQPKWQYLHHNQSQNINVKQIEWQNVEKNTKMNVTYGSKYSRMDISQFRVASGTGCGHHKYLCSHWNWFHLNQFHLNLFDDSNRIVRICTKTIWIGLSCNKRLILLLNNLTFPFRCFKLPLYFLASPYPE